MKKCLVILFVLFLAKNYAQEKNFVLEKEKTKMDVFAYKTGVIVKFIDYNLPDIKSSFGVVVNTRIRKVISGTIINYFFQIEKSGQYGKSIASIEYSDLIEASKALQSLKIELDKDLLINSDYLENKFTTIDGFKIGYYIQKGKIGWYLSLEKSGSDNTVFVKDVLLIEDSFKDAINKIEELKKN